MQQVMIFAQGGQALGKIDFTENDECIDFTLSQGTLRMAPSYMESELNCTVDEFVAAGTEFIRGELRRVTSEYPSLARNSHVRALARDVGLEIPE
ncbi:hypothetical protein ABZ297_34330 [Nonomuraea sp. NPDC005983]|uniref:hypothetical protein n=1 Tax=Nonomuraea sp. NPDC005983 TaxID=3155595 RepID=UPI0033BBD8AA